MLSSTEYQPKRVIQILSGSRSGSSLLKSLLAKSISLVSLAGEEEPYFAYTGNGYGLTSDSDGFSTMRNPALFRRCIQTELEANRPWEWRLGLQYRGQTLARLLESLPDMIFVEGWLRQMGVFGLYDACPSRERQPIREMAYEMAPFVQPILLPQEGDTLLIKAPYNAYRPGLMESIWPEAEFSYVILQRNPAATINGLIDGWKANYGFYKHLTPHGWWKFDLPPEWKTAWCASIPERCRLQWYSTYNRLTYRRGYVVKFEELLTNTEETVKNLCQAIDIEPPADLELPLVMATEPPRPFRWKARESVILELLDNRPAMDLIRRLGYNDMAQWI